MGREVSLCMRGSLGSRGDGDGDGDGETGRTLFVEGFRDGGVVGVAEGAAEAGARGWRLHGCGMFGGWVDGLSCCSGREVGGWRCVSFFEVRKLVVALRHGSIGSSRLLYVHMPGMYRY